MPSGYTAKKKKLEVALGSSTALAYPMRVQDNKTGNPSAIIAIKPEAFI